MSRDPQAAAKARKAEQKAAGITIKPISLSASDTPSSNANSNSKAGTGFKKGGFRSAFGDEDDGGKGTVEGEKGMVKGTEKEEKRQVRVEGREVESEDEDDGRWGDYDPRRPTGCGEGCSRRR